MPNPNGSFQGQTLIIPNVYYADNVSAVNPTTPPTTPPLIFIGYGYGGKPKTPITVTDPTTLLNTIRGGPCSGYVQFMTNPSNQVNGAQIITFINAGQATQSTLTLSGTGAGLMTMTSTNYGVPSNLLQANVTAGSLAGKKLTLRDNYANQQIVGDNLGVPFQVAYTGAATSGLSFSVAVSGLNATSFTVTSPLAGESQTILIGAGQYTQVQQIAEYLNGTGLWSAIPIGDGTLPATYLDVVSGTALTPVSASVYQYSNVTASLGSVLYFVNQYAGGFATAVASGSITGFASGQVPINIINTSFTGATSTPPTNSDYASGFNVALTIPGWAVFADSNAPAVQALLSQHVVTASSITNARYRRGFTGSSLGDAVATTIAAAQAANAREVCYAYPGIYRVDTNTGIDVLWSGNYVAAAAAGMATGNNVALPLTNKSLVGTGVETLLTVSQINQLQQAGVMLININTTTNVPTIVSDLTTWQNDSNPENIFTQQVACRQYLAYSMLNSLNAYIGQIAAPPTIIQVRRAVSDTLNALIFVNGNNGILAAWDSNSLQLVYTGSNQTLAITVDVVLVGQVRFITVYIPLLPINLVG